jgi:argininosuccinate lyase
MSKLWGTRFDKRSDKLADKFTFSISYDYRLAKYDVIGSIAHAQMLGKQRIIPKSDATKIVVGLKKLLKQIEMGKFEYDPYAEDIHTNIQNRLKALIGKPADKLHTARSRNDQVVLDTKLYCLEHVLFLIFTIENLQKAIVSFAKKNNDVIIPGYTHLQQAQVVLLAHHMLAYVEMLARDKARLEDCFKRVNVMPLGSCALAGTSLKTDRPYVARLLQFAQVAANSMDVVSDRDFIVELISASSITAMHLSRIAEDMILWSTKEFNFIDIDSSFCTGSSIMPHKKNPDVLELMRGSTGKIYGHLMEVLVLLKGLPLAYNRDLQLDKPPLFDTVESLQLMLDLLTKIFSSLKVKQQEVIKHINDESFFCVDVMDYLVKKGVSYRDAHDVLGKMVKECIDQGISIVSLSKTQLQQYHPLFQEDVKKLFNPQTSVKIKTSLGSTNPNLVNQQLQQWSKKLRA